MKTITLYQPWATLVAIGAKRIETRSWSTRHRGPLLIHAAKERKFIDGRSKKYICDSDPFYSALTDLFKGMGCPLGALPLGAIVAWVNLVDVRPITKSFKTDLAFVTQPDPNLEFHFGDYTPGRFAWILQNVRRIRPAVPTRGKQGLWEFPGKLH